MREEVKVLLTGASGTVGKEVLNQLCESDQFDITVFDVKTNHAKKNFEP
ncbi:hypothetical protein MNBD_IGNAVI01-1712 [hydrothermal vent metagenome]|uniref:Uncharacterized protein n=1 Tax=hydrothermal vent metagenome TaxID=652676 RepID=A0A3B1BVW1_9ZZZZ